MAGAASALEDMLVDEVRKKGRRSRGGEMGMIIVQLTNTNNSKNNIPLLIHTHTQQTQIHKHTHAHMRICMKMFVSK